MVVTDRQLLVGEAVKAMVLWTRLLDSAHSAPFGELNLSRSQLEVLFHVAQNPDPATPGSVAARLGITAGAVTQLIGPLVDLGLLRQRRDEADGRRRLLVLEPAARKQIDAFEHAMTQALAPRFDDLSDDDLATLTSLLARTTELRP